MAKRTGHIALTQEFLIEQLSAMEQRLDAKMNSKIDEFGTRIDMKINGLDQKFDSKIDSAALSFKEYTDSRFSQLKIQMAEGFEKVDKRFEQVDKRFEQIDKRFDRLEKKLKTNTEGLVEMIQRMAGGHAERIANLEAAR